MRRLFTVEEARAEGLTTPALRWGERSGRWRRIDRGVYAEVSEAPAAIDIARAAALAADGVVSGRVAATLLGFDGITMRGPDVSVGRTGNARRPGVRRRSLSPDRVIEIAGVSCTNAFQTLVDLAADVSADMWEQAYESARRKGLVGRADFDEVPPGTRGIGVIREALSHSDDTTPPTESLLETLMVQLARTVPGLPPPTRQHVVYDTHGQFVARVDLTWLELGFFNELDGEHHAGQPLYDARRETAVVAATGWLCGRFTWTEVTRFPRSTARRLGALAEQARRRPLPQG